MSQTHQRGNTPLAFTDDAFTHGYQVGYLQFKVEYATKTPDVMDIYSLIVGVITSVHHSGRYLAGYVTGWIAALIEGYKPSVIASSVLHATTEEVKL